MTRSTSAASEPMGGPVGDRAAPGAVCATGDFSASAQGKALMYNVVSLETPKPGALTPGSDLSQPYLDGGAAMTAFDFTLPEHFSLDPCDHEHVDIRAVTCSNGAIQYVKQCLNCGEKVGTAMRHADVAAARGNLEFIAPFDDALRDRGRAKRDDYRRVMPADERMAIRAQERAESFQVQRARLGDWYREYLKSDEWAEKRTLVMYRAGGICEGCRSRKASVVHHLNYDHVGNELLFELVALCRGCHDRCHGVSQ
jgi:5-methylcytosine-specific restriction endonuclease McrA